MIIKNAKLISFLTEVGAPQMADVLVEGKKIAAIAPCGSLQEDGHKILDIHGATLMPGMIDAHVHLFNGKPSGGFTYGDRVSVPAQWAFDSYNFARWFLDNGYTTVRDVGDEENYSGIAVRNAVNEGIIAGPRIYCTGMTIVPYTPGFASFKFMCAFYGSPEEARKQAREQFYRGADLLKLYGTGSMMVEDSLPGRRIMMKDEISACVAVAENQGSYCACHCHGAEAIGVMIDLGVRTIEHASYITDDSCKKLDGRKDTGIVPTIACSTPEATGISPDDPVFKARNDERDACIRNAYENYDILMGWGTDMDIATMEKLPYIEWQARKNRLGFSNEDLLKQATINSAMLMGIDSKVGTIEVGKLADMIVIEGDPVKEIEAMYQKPLHVMKDGELIR